MSYEIASAQPEDAGIRESTREPDGVDVFATFREAQRSLANQLEKRREAYMKAIVRVHRMHAGDAAPL